MGCFEARHLRDADHVRTIIDLLEFRAEREPDHVAYTYLRDGESDEVHLDYGRLARRAREIAAVLQRYSTPGSRALLLYPPGLEFIEGIFGCLYAGCVAVPVYPPDPTRLERSVPRMRAVAENAGASVVLTTSYVRDQGAALFEPLPELQRLRWVATDEAPADAGANWKEPSVTEASLAILQYTSGSTGLPKGVMLAHRNIVSTLDVIHRVGEAAEDGEERAVIWLPQFHDFGLFEGCFFPVFAQEKPRVLMSPIDFLQRPVRWLRAMSRYRATVSGAPNFAYELCLRKVRPEQRAELDLSHWEVAFCGAEPIRPATLERFAEAFAPCGFRKEAFYPCYGLAEATLCVAGSRRMQGARAVTLDSDALEKGRAIMCDRERPRARTFITCGRAAPHVALRVVDSATREPCPNGWVGEIWIRDGDVGLGYWNRAEESERCFRAYTTSGEGPFLRSGDLGFLDEESGELVVTGRAKDLIIIRGRNLYPQDIEQSVEACHKAIRRGNGAAVALDCAGEEALGIVYEVYPWAWKQAEEIVSAIRRAVAEQHQVQAKVVALVAPGTVPKTSSGKIQRHACALLAADPGPQAIAQSRLT